MPANANQKIWRLPVSKRKNGKRIPEVVSIQSLKILREKFSHFIKKAFIGFIRMWFEIR